MSSTSTSLTPLFAYWTTHSNLLREFPCIYTAAESFCTTNTVYLLSRLKKTGILSFSRCLGAWQFTREDSLISLFWGKLTTRKPPPSWRATMRVRSPVLWHKFLHFSIKVSNIFCFPDSCVSLFLVQKAWKWPLRTMLEDCHWPSSWISSLSKTKLVRMN